MAKLSDFLSPPYKLPLDSYCSLRIMGSTNNATGLNNVAIGYDSLKNDVSGVGNVAFGVNSLKTNTSGSNSIAIGSNALSIYNATGGNVAIGFEAAKCTTTGSLNTAIGYQSLLNTTTGSGNTAIGRSTLQMNTVGFCNTAIGTQSLYSNTSGSNNTANGYGALLCNTSGTANTAIGSNALYYNSSGSCNIGLGYLSGCAITTGTGNVIIGSNTGSAGLTNCIILSDGAGSNRFNITCSGSVCIPTSVSSTTSATGSLIVAGGIGVGENINLSGDITVSGGDIKTGPAVVSTLFSDTTTGNIALAGSLTTGTFTIGATGSTGTANLFPTTGAQNVTIGSSTTGTITIGSTSATAIQFPTGKTKIGQTILAQGGAVTSTFPTVAGTLVGSGDTGTVSTTMLANDSVTYDKLQNISAQYRVLGRVSASAGNAEELTSDNLITLLNQATTSLTLTFYLGTTSIALNRASGSQSLTGVSIDGNAGTVTNGVYSSRTINTTSPLAGGGDLSTDRTLSLSANYGDTLNPYASKTANYFLASPNGTAGVPTFRAIVAADIPTLNQNTTGSSGSVANSLTFNTSGGATAGTTYNGSAARTIDYSTVGAAASGHTHSYLPLDGGTLTGQLISTLANNTATGSGQIYLNGTTGNRIDWNGNGVAAPAFTTRSAGTKLVLYPAVSASAVDYALGIESGNMWFSTTENTASGFKWYHGTTNTMSLLSTGILSVVTGFRINNAATSGQYLRGNGTNFVSSAIQAADVPTLNQNTTGSAGSVSNALTIGSYLTGTSYNGSAAVTIAVDATTANTGSKIVARDVNGDIYSRYCNASYFNSSDDVNAGTVTYIMAKFGDNYFRSASAAKVATFISGQTMNISGSATTLIGDQTNWASYRSSTVANMLGWKNYGNAHVIFDASNSTSPTGTAVNNTNAATAWSSTYPTLMGWNGASTYGVRVDSARVADSATTATYLTTTQLNARVTGQSNSLAMTVSDSTNLGSFVARASGTGDANLAGMTFWNDSYAIKIGIRADGYIGIGGWSRAAWSWYSDPSGNMVAAGNVTAYSDPRLKENFKKINNPLYILEQLDGGTFTWKKDIPHIQGKAGKRDYGILADQVEKVMPEIVTESIEIEGEKYKTVAYEKLVPVLIEAIKELSNKIKELEGKNVKV